MKFLPFEEAREYMWELNFLSTPEYNQWLKTKKRPKFIPDNPNTVYEDDWISMRNYIGNDWLTYDEAKAYMIEDESHIKTSTQYKKWSKTNERPVILPSAPQSFYREEWVSWRDFLGAPSRATQYREFNAARSFVRKLKIRTQEDWYKWCRAGNIPEDMPMNPHFAYGVGRPQTGWTGWRDWLGPYARYISYDDLQKLVEGKNFRNSSHYSLWFRENKLYRNENGSRLPSQPSAVYKEWLGWKSFLKPLSLRGLNFLSFEAARKETRKIGLKNYKDWLTWCRLGKRPAKIPADPYTMYKGDFISWPDWLVESK